ARAAAYYQRVDALALGLVLTMGLAFVVGLVDLAQRVQRVERLTRELAKLPAPATVAAVDGSSAELRAILRARIAHAPAPVSSALAPLTTQHRQLVALEELARHGDALPRAATALSEAAARLGALEAAWSAAHREAAAETSRALRGAVDDVRADLRGAIDRAG